MLDSTGLDRTADSRLLCITVMRWVTRPLIQAWPRHHARSRHHAILITARCTDTSAATFSGVRVGPLDDVDGGTDVMLGNMSVLYDCRVWPAEDHVRWVASIRGRHC